MPELPEVETVRRQLIPNVLHKKIVQCVASVPKIVGNNPDFPRKIIGQEFSGIDRIGKLIIFKLKNTTDVILCHLKMTGQLIYQSAQTKAGGGHTLTKSDLNLPNKHTHVQFEFEDGSELFFNDQRKFGYLKFGSAEDERIARSRFGIEPLTPEYTWENFRGIFPRRKTTIKALLLNQSLIAGLGNIYVDEACFRAGVKPDRTVDKVTKADQQKLFQTCSDVLEESIAAGGTTFYNFAHTDGSSGSYFDQLDVFAREGQPCHVCGTEIVKTKVAQRGTHHCPQCQT